MKQKSTAGNPYKILYWMGAGVFVLLIGVFVLAKLMPKSPPPDPLRTLIWLYDPGNKSGPSAAAIIEESKVHGTTIMVPFNAPSDVRQVFQQGGSRKAQQALAGQLGLNLYNRLFLPHPVLVTLVDGFGGVTVEGKTLKGSEAVAYIQDGPEDRLANRATRVLISLAGTALERTPNLSASDLLRLANQVETSMDLTSLSDRFGDWASAVLRAPPSGNPAEWKDVFLPDPPPPGK